MIGVPGCEANRERMESTRVKSLALHSSAFRKPGELRLHVNALMAGRGGAHLELGQLGFGHEVGGDVEVERVGGAHPRAHQCQIVADTVWSRGINEKKV
jgi:hypothetical protein